MSRLLFAWLLLAGMVSLLAHSARTADGPVGRSAIIASETDKNLRILALGAATQPDETLLDPAANHDAHASLWGASSRTPRHRQTAGRLFVGEPAREESVLAKTLPIRGPPDARRG